MDKIFSVTESPHWESIKQALDAMSVVATIGALASVLPEISALFSIIWLGIRIWESETVKGWTGRSAPR